MTESFIGLREKIIDLFTFKITHRLATEIKMRKIFKPVNFAVMLMVLLISGAVWFSLGFRHRIFEISGMINPPATGISAGTLTGLECAQGGRRPMAAVIVEDLVRGRGVCASRRMEVRRN